MNKCVKFAIFVCLCSICNAATYYVDPVSGDNGDNGSSEALAFATINYAITQATAGDTVYLMDGNYVDILLDTFDDLGAGVDYNDVNDSISYITLIALNDRQAVFDSSTNPYALTFASAYNANDPLAYASKKFGGLKFEDCTFNDGVAIENIYGLWFEDCDVIYDMPIATNADVDAIMDSTGSEGFHSGNCSNLKIQNCKIANWRNGVDGSYFALDVHDCNIYDIAEDHLHFSGGSTSEADGIYSKNLNITNNYIIDSIPYSGSKDIHSDAIQVYGKGIYGVNIISNFIYNHRVQGIFFSGDETRCEDVNIINNLIQNIAGIELNINNCKNAVIAHNTASSIKISLESENVVMYNNLFGPWSIWVPRGMTQQNIKDGKVAVALKGSGSNLTGTISVSDAVTLTGGETGTVVRAYNDSGANLWYINVLLDDANGIVPDDVNIVVDGSNFINSTEKTSHTNKLTTCFTYIDYNYEMGYWGGASGSDGYYYPINEVLTSMADNVQYNGYATNFAGYWALFCTDYANGDYTPIASSDTIDQGVGGRGDANVDILGVNRNPTPDIGAYEYVPSGVDITAPTPNPMTWSSEPSATNSSTIAMTATTATDESGGIEYYFNETTGHAGATDSGWQSSASYTDTGLSAATTYTYTVQARDVYGNITGASDAVSVITPTAGSGGSYDPNIVGLWNFDDNTDSNTIFCETGDANGVFYIGTDPANTTGGTVTGKVNNALRFNYVDQPNTVHGLITGFVIPSSYSVAFWFNPGTYQADDVILHYGNGGSNGFIFYMDGGNLRFKLSSSSTVTESSGITYNTWQHIVLTSDGDFYLNGTQQTATTTDTYTDGAGTDFYIARDYNGGNYTRGYYDQLVIYDYVLTSADRSYLYNSGDGVEITGIITEPVAPSGLTATASSVSQINLTWVDNSDNETGFKIQKSTNGIDYVALTTTAANLTTYSDTGLTHSTQYWYKVASTNSSGDSSYTTAASDTTNSPPDPCYVTNFAELLAAIDDYNDIYINTATFTWTGQIVIGKNTTIKPHPDQSSVTVIGNGEIILGTRTRLEFNNK